MWRVLGVRVENGSKVLQTGFESDTLAAALIASAAVMNRAQMVQAHALDARVFSSRPELRLTEAKGSQDE
jgi:hypothetical protein